MKKPTMQMIADAVGVSRITVWKVLNNRPGVSPALSNQILETAVQMGYPTLEVLSSTPVVTPEVQTESLDSSRAISVVVSRPNSSAFWTNIIHEIAKEASRRNCAMLYTYIPYDADDSYTLPDVLSSGAVSGIIVLNVYDTRILNALNSLDLPKVFLDCISTFPIDALTGDLVLLEGARAVQKITEHLISRGRTKIGFIGDIQYALTNQLRYKGYLHAMQANHLPVPVQFCYTSSIGVQTDMSEIHAFLDSLEEMPDAFVCVSDYVANYVYLYLYENHYSVPGDVALSGYDNMSEFLDIADLITTVNIDTEQLGRRLFHQLSYRIEWPEADAEVLYVRPRIIYRKSTDC